VERSVIKRANNIISISYREIQPGFASGEHCTKCKRREKRWKKRGLGYLDPNMMLNQRGRIIDREREEG
jgi:hypothetical protein